MSAFDRPEYVGRGFRASSNVQIGGGARIGNDVKIEGDVVIGKGVTVEDGVLLLGSISIGDGTCIGRYTYIGTGPQGRVSIGSDVHVNQFSNFGAMSALTIQDHCIFAAYVQITDAEHGMDPDLHVKHAPIRAEPVTIGEGVWLGSHVVVLIGVAIGAGSVIGAHSLVNDDIPDNSIAYGIPATVRRDRSQLRAC